ncbi:MAG: hypothetical protein F3741_09130 [Nitrospinae bacterium]|nr:hypothetical protein [Nitrospinota bacterium]
MKQRIGEILEPESKSDFLSRGFNIFIISLIILNVFAVSVETMQELSSGFLCSFSLLNIFCAYGLVT